MEQPIISPISKELLKSELTPDKQLRMTNKSNNKIFIITAHNAPNVMLEIGRLREIAFREAGGGTGKEADIDEFDTCENCYKQLIVWNPDEEEIGSMTVMVSPSLPPVTCSISQRNSFVTMRQGPLNWDVRSYLCHISLHEWVPKAFLRLTTYGTDWEPFPSFAPTSNTTSAR